MDEESVAKQQCNRKQQLIGCHDNSNQCTCQLWEGKSEDDDLKDNLREDETV